MKKLSRAQICQFGVYNDIRKPFRHCFPLSEDLLLRIITNSCNPWAAILLKLLSCSYISKHLSESITGADVSETLYILTELKCYYENVNNTKHIHIFIMKHSLWRKILDLI